MRRETQPRNSLVAFVSQFSLDMISHLKGAAAYTVVTLIYSFLVLSGSRVALGQEPKYKEPTHEDLNVEGVRVLQGHAKQGLYNEVAIFQSNLREGGRVEDNNPRWLYHFYQPFSQEGLSLVGGSFGSALEWARDDADISGPFSTDRTWKGAIQKYGYTRTSREKAYLRLGQVAHLVADMANPEHVHNEPHGSSFFSPDPEKLFTEYESWVVDNAGDYVNGDNLDPYVAQQMELFLKDMAEKTYTLSSFPGDLNQGTQDSNSIFDALFNIEYEERTIRDDRWLLFNKSKVDNNETFLGTWDGSTIFCEDCPGDDDEWREVTEEANNAPSNHYFIEKITDAIPAKKPALENGSLVLRDWDGEPKTLADAYASQLLPMAVEHIAGLYKFYHDIVNPPPYVSKVEIISSSGCIYRAKWKDILNDNNRVTSRTLERDQNCNTPWLQGQTADIKIDFGRLSSGVGTEKMDNVTVTVGGKEINGRLEEDGKRWRGTANAPQISGNATIKIEAEDAHNHYTNREHPGDLLDSDPSTPAKASYSANPTSPAYSWTNYTPGADTQHEVTIGTDRDEADVALVLDRSGSMGFLNFIGPAKNAAKNFVNLLQPGDGLAVASFNWNASVDFAFTRIQSDQDKADARSNIDALSAFDGTNIGRGIKAGLGELEKGNTSQTQGMVLLTDGFGPVGDALSQVPENVDIYTIALGTNADQELLNDIASQTGGSFNISPTTSELQGIYDQIRTQITGQQTIASTSETINQGQQTSTQAQVDGSTTKSFFSALWPGSDVDLTLEGPNGRVIDPETASSDPSITFSSGNTFETYTVTDPEQGSWTMTALGTNIPEGGEPVTLSATANSDLEMDLSFDRPSYPLGEHIFIRAEITDDGSPVTGANVTAEVTKPTQKSAQVMHTASTAKVSDRGTVKSMANRSDWTPTSPVQLTNTGGAYVDQSGTAYYQKSNGDLKLYDDGNHGDGAANDGVYANFYDETGTGGSYTFDVSATGETSNSGSFTREGSRSTVVSSSAPTANCPGPLTISDFDSEQPDDPDTEEYVKISNTGPSPASLDECALVFFDGADSESYFSMNLEGTIGSGATFTIGNPGLGDVMKTFPNNTLQDGPDAIALYRDDASNFPEGTPVTVQNLISSIVYISDDNIYTMSKSAGPASSGQALMRLGEIADRAEGPVEFALENSPNPFSGRTTIRYGLPEQSDVRLVVYDLLGRRVRSLEASTKEAGRHQITLDTDDLSAGTYFLRLTAGDRVKTHSIQVVR